MGRHVRVAAAAAAALVCLSGGLSGCSGPEPLPSGSYVGMSPSATASSSSTPSATPSAPTGPTVPAEVDSAVANLAEQQRRLRETDTSRNALAAINDGLGTTRSGLKTVRDFAFGTDKSCAKVAAGLATTKSGAGVVTRNAPAAFTANERRRAAAGAVSTAASAVESAVKAAGLAIAALTDVAAAVKDARAQASDAVAQARDADSTAAKAKATAADLVATASSIAAKAC